MNNQHLYAKIARFCSGKKDIAACYVFGSYAAGTNRRGSDLDLAFLLAPDTSPASFDEFRFAVITELGRISRLDVHPLIMNTAGEFVLDQVFRKGLCLYQRDEETPRAFRRRKLPMIAEFSYYIQMMRDKLAQRYRVSGHG